MGRKSENVIIIVCTFVVPLIAYLVVDVLEKGVTPTLPTIPIEEITIGAPIIVAALIFISGVIIESLLWMFRWRGDLWRQRKSLVIGEEEERSRPDSIAVGKKVLAEQFQDMCSNLIAKRKKVRRIQKSLEFKKIEREEAIAGGTPTAPADTTAIDGEISALETESTNLNTEIDTAEKVLEARKKLMLEKYPEYFYFLRKY